MFNETAISFSRQVKLGRIFCCGLFFFSLVFFISQVARADTALKFEKSTVYGDVLDQAANAVELSAGRLYIAGSESAAAMKALAVGYDAPPAGDPLFSFRWQSDANLLSTENFTDVAATADSIYFTGQSWSTKTKQSWPFLAKFSNQGKSQSGAHVWLARPQLFEKNQEGAFYAVLPVQEDAGTVIYAAGYASSQSTNRTAILAKYDLNGNFLWFKKLSSEGERSRGAGVSLAMQDGAIYVGGYTDNGGDKKGDIDNIPLYTTLWKYDASGKEIWRESETDSRLNFMKGEAKDVKVDLAGLENFLYLAVAKKKGDGADVLLLKYDANGTRLWDAVWDGKSAAGFARAAFPAGLVTDKGRLYVAGWTELPGKKGSAANEDAFVLEVDKEYGSLLATHEYGESAQNERALGVQTDGVAVYLVGSQRAPADKGKTAQSDLTLFQYKIQPIMNVKIEIQPETKKPAKKDKEEKQEKKASKIAVTIFSDNGFNATKDVNTKSLTFGRTGYEPSWDSCAVKDANSDSIFDLVCYFEPQFKFQKDQVDILSEKDTKGILRGDTVSGTRFMGTAKLGAGTPDFDTPTEEVPAPTVTTPPVPVSAPLVSAGTPVQPAPIETPPVITPPAPVAEPLVSVGAPIQAPLAELPPVVAPPSQVPAPLISTEAPVAPTPPPVEAPAVVAPEAPVVAPVITSVAAPVAPAPIETSSVVTSQAPAVTPPALVSAPLVSTGTPAQLPKFETAPASTLQAPLTTSAPVVAAPVTSPTTSTAATATATAPKNITALQPPKLISAPLRTTTVSPPVSTAPLLTTPPAPAAPSQEAAPAAGTTTSQAAVPVATTTTSAEQIFAPASTFRVLGARGAVSTSGATTSANRISASPDASNVLRSFEIPASPVQKPLQTREDTPSSATPEAGSASSGTGLTQAYNDMGQEALKSGKPQEAIVYFQEALKLDPRSVEAHTSVGLALVKAGKLEQAKGHLLEAAKLKPGDEDIQKQLQAVLDQLGEQMDLTDLGGSSGEAGGEVTGSQVPK